MCLKGSPLLQEISFKNLCVTQCQQRTSERMHAGGLQGAMSLVRKSHRELASSVLSRCHSTMRMSHCCIHVLIRLDE